MPYDFIKRAKSLFGMGPKDVNLPIEGAVPAAQARAAKEKSAEIIDKLKQVGERVRKAQPAQRDSQSASYDFRQRNNLKRGQ